MARRGTKKRAPRQACAGADVATAVRDKIARGRSKGALEDAKRLAKEAPGPEHDALLGEAYAARADALQRAGMSNEAQELLAAARRRLPELAARWDAAATDLALRSGDLSETLRAWAQGDTPKEQLSGLIAAHAVDLERIAAAPELGPEDPLRLAAGALQRAFVEAAGGRLSEAARLALRAVPRGSPLGAWRSLTLAIAAFHQQDDDIVRAHLERIPAGVSVRPLADLLRRLVDGEAPDGLGPAVRRLIERLGGGIQGERDALDQLRTAVARDDEGAAAGAAARLLVALVKTDPRLAQRLARWIARKLDPEDQRLAKVLRRTIGEEWLRLQALEEGANDPAGAAMCWIIWLMPDPERPLRQLDDVELALVLDLVAPAVDSFVEDLSAELREMGLGDHVTDLSTPEGAQRFAAGLSVLLLDEGGEEVWSGIPFLILHLVRVLDQRVRPFPIRWQNPGGRLLQIASELDPTADRFRALFHAARRLGARERKMLLERWAERLPEDVEPVLRLVEAAERRSAHRQAEGHLERAERLAPVDERVRAARFRILLQSLHAHLRRQKPHLCVQDLEKLAATPAAADPDRALYLVAARRSVAELGGHGLEKASHELETACGDPVLADVMLRLVAALAGGRDIDMSQVPRGARAVPVVLPLLRVLGAVAPGIRLVAPGRWLAGCTAADMPSDTRDLALLCSALNHYEDADLLHLCSGLGLRHEGMLLPRFLMYRWLALRGSLEWSEHGEEVGRLALALACRYQDQEVVRELRQATRYSWGPSLEGLEPLDEKESAAWLQRERDLSGTLAERRSSWKLSSSKGAADQGGRARRGPRRQRQPRRQRGRRRGDRTGLLQFMEEQA